MMRRPFGIGFKGISLPQRKTVWPFPKDSAGMADVCGNSWAPRAGFIRNFPKDGGGWLIQTGTPFLAMECVMVPEWDITA